MYSKTSSSATVITVLAIASFQWWDLVAVRRTWVAWTGSKVMTVVPSTVSPAATWFQVSPSVETSMT